jgi:integrase
VKRRLFEKHELEQTIAAAGETYGTLFTPAALTGARVSELLALRWADVRISDLEDAEVEFACQVDRHGNVRPTKTDGSARTVPIPAELAAILRRHKDRARYSTPQDFVFSTCTGRPLGQRNVAVAFLLGHRDADVTRAVYLRELSDARRRTIAPVAHGRRIR